tara:strand:- start:3892 stop:4143 length:252 start_codon:yes stop_codon:yes gene_type:complete
MALTKEYSVDYEIRTEYRHIQIREKTSIMEDGKELSHSFHRRVLTPDADVSNETDEIKGMTDVLWTDAVKKAWDDKLKADAGS